MSNQQFAERLIEEIRREEQLICAGREGALVEGYKLAHKHIIEIIQDEAKKEV